MKKIYQLMLVSAVTMSAALSGFAGNPDRAGQAGATELLINPWARSSGWGLANSGSVHGLEAVFGNVAGIAFTKKTEVIFSHSIWLQGSEVGINSFGLTQKVSEGSVMGVSIMSMSFGEIPITTVDAPEGGIGTFSPQFLNLSIAYAKAFSSSIYGGINFKVISESISNIGAQGVAIDAGIQYVTGNNEDKDNIKFGICLKNVGTPMKFEGDALSTRVITSSYPQYELSVQQRTEGFEMPSLLNIGVTYDFNLAKDHRISTAGCFTSNSFTQDQYSLGLEYGFREYFMLRGGFTYEENIFDDILRTTAYTGPSAGFTLQVPFGKSGKSFSVDYSYRATQPFDGTHSFGAKFTL